jgi:DeoR family suf operon transcriptional repressor
MRAVAEAARTREGIEEGLWLLPPARRAVLAALKATGGATADALALELGLAPSSVRQHLASLAADGLVVHEALRHGPGRPRHRYQLSPAADGLFPRAYARLANDLLEEIGAGEPAALARLVRRLRDRRLRAAAPRLAGRTLRERCDELARILEEDGYVASAEHGADGSCILRERNCAILAVASRHPEACAAELEFLRSALPDADVSRLEHRLEGAACCSYCVVPRAHRAPAWA